VAVGVLVDVALVGEVLEVVGIGLSLYRFMRLRPPQIWLVLPLHWILQDAASSAGPWREFGSLPAQHSRPGRVSTHRRKNIDMGLLTVLGSEVLHLPRGGESSAVLERHVVRGLKNRQRAATTTAIGPASLKQPVSDAGGGGGSSGRDVGFIFIETESRRATAESRGVSSAFGGAFRVVVGEGSC